MTLQQRDKRRGDNDGKDRHGHRSRLWYRNGAPAHQIGMIHYVDSEEDFRTVFEGPVLAYAKELKEKGVILHIAWAPTIPISH